MTIQNARSNTAGNVPPGSVDGQFQINQVDDVLFTHKPNGTTRPFLLPKRRGISDALIAIGPTETYIGIASLTQSRAVGLPPAANYPVGHPLAVVDESGAVSPTVALTLTPQGTDKINGVATVALTTPFSGVLLFSDGASRWTVMALPAGTASNALLYVQQSLTAGQQDQARANLSGAMAAAPSATTTLVALDFDRDQFVTGTSTLTMPSSIAPGWRSGTISNANAVSGLVTLAVPSGHSLDGVTNGSTILFPYQRARLQLISAGVWRTSWVDRTPVIAAVSVPSGTPVASLDIAVPAGYSRFALDVCGALLTTTGALLQWRSSDNGTTGLRTGANDYSTQQVVGYGGTVAASQTASPAGFLTNASYGSTDPNQSINGHYEFYPGDPTGTRYHKMVGRLFYTDNGPNNISANIDSQNSGSTSGMPARCNLIRILASAGSLYGSFYLRGLA